MIRFIFELTSLSAISAFDGSIRTLLEMYQGLLIWQLLHATMFCIWALKLHWVQVISNTRMTLNQSFKLAQPNWYIAFHRALEMIPEPFLKTRITSQGTACLTLVRIYHDLHAYDAAEVRWVVLILMFDQIINIQMRCLDQWTLVNFYRSGHIFLFSYFNF